MLEELEKKEAELIEQLKEVRAKIKVEKLKIAEEKFGVKVGSIVVYRGVEHRITKVDTRWDKPWLEGNPKRKDGSFGTAVRNLYSDWTKVLA